MYDRREVNNMGFMRNRNTKIVSLAVLLGVLCITVGYAAFSSVLTFCFDDDIINLLIFQQVQVAW